jgi:predicted alpha/beta hydrolase
MPTFTDPQRWLVPAVLLLSVVGIPLALWWERRHPSVPAGVAEMRAWRRLSTAEQESVDTAALDLGEQAVLDVEADAGDAARDLVHRARVNALYRP